VSKAEDGGFTQLIGLSLSRREQGTCSSELQLDERHMSIAARAHGGLLATMLDTTLGCAVFGAIPAGRGCATLSFSIHFFRPVTEGRLHCEARVGNLSRQTAFATGEIRDDRGRLIASASGTFFITPTMAQNPKFAP